MGPSPIFERPSVPESEDEERVGLTDKDKGELYLKRGEYLLEQLDIDPLTGLKNRRGFEKDIEKALEVVRNREQSEQRRKPFEEISIISIDIDKFKDINDGLGHAAGDAVLREIGTLLLHSIRKTDTVARVGGEELMVLMPGADLGTAHREAEELRTKIKGMTVHGYSELDKTVTASFGVVSSRSSTDAKTLQKFADEALYRAKRSGRDKVEVHVGT